MKCIVADSGPLIALAGVGQLRLPSAVFGEALITETVLGECLVDPLRPDAQAIQRAIADGQLLVVPDPPIPPEFEQLSLDAGERSALVYAAENGAAVLIDEVRGRRKAREIGIPVIGFCGLLLLAKRHTLIPAVGPLLLLAQEHGYYLGEVLVAQVLQIANES